MVGGGFDGIGFGGETAVARQVMLEYGRYVLSKQGGAA